VAVSPFRRAMSATAIRALVLGTIGAGAAAAFALVTRRVAARVTSVDREVLERAGVEEGHPVRNVAAKVHPLGKWWTYVPTAALTGGYVVASKRRVAGSLSILAAAGCAYALSNVFDDLLPQPPAPPGRDRPDHPVFPSGHAFGTTSVALAAAYVLTREELAPASLAYPIALAIPLLTSTARVIEEKHWITDIAGGLLAALALSSLTCAAYEACGDGLPPVP
jgi:membrane-associated phospholipid phosphatase